MHVLLKTLIIVALLTFVKVSYACCESELKDPPASVEILAPTFSVTGTDGPQLLTVVGTFRNKTETTVGDLVVEARLLDTTGNVVDVLSQPVYGLLVRAGQEVSFRMQGPAAVQASAYASVQARVTSGVSQQPRPPRSERREESQLVSLLVSWGPMLLLIVVWIYMARKYSGKGSAQDRTIDLIAEQNVILSKQLAAIEAIAAAAGSAWPKTDG